MYNVGDKVRIKACGSNQPSVFKAKIVGYYDDGYVNVKVLENYGSWRANSPNNNTINAIAVDRIIEKIEEEMPESIGEALQKENQEKINLQILEEAIRSAELRGRNGARERFAHQVMEYSNGCVSGKKDFLEYAGLEDYLPVNEAVFTVRVTWPYGVENTQHAMEQAIQDGLENYEPACETDVTCDQYDEVGE